MWLQYNSYISYGDILSKLLPTRKMFHFCELIIYIYIYIYSVCVCVCVRKKEVTKIWGVGWEEVVNQVILSKK
jgi:hypothetical protein